MLLLHGNARAPDAHAQHWHACQPTFHTAVVCASTFVCCRSVCAVAHIGLHRVVRSTCTKRIGRASTLHPCVHGLGTAAMLCAVLCCAVSGGRDGWTAAGAGRNQRRGAAAAQLGCSSRDLGGECMGVCVGGVQLLSPACTGSLVLTAAVSAWQGRTEGAETHVEECVSTAAIA
jgi:hypothetical protein